MIDRLIEYVLGNVFEVLIFLFLGLILGILFSYIYWKGQVNTRDSTIKDLDASLEGKNVIVKKLYLAQKRLKNKYAEIGSLNRQLEENVRNRVTLSEQINEKVIGLEGDFKTKLEKREQNIQSLNNQVNEKNQSIDFLENKVATLEEMNRNLVNLTDELKTGLAETEQSEGDFKTKLEKREQNIQSLNILVNEKDESINLLENKVVTMEEMNQESVNLTDQLKISLVETERSVEELKNEISSNVARLSLMQDDFTHIVGIGPKVSSVLRVAGINNFKKLGSINFDRLREILEAENPNLLRLIDPLTWPEQARLASEEDWEGLSALQESLKGSRRNGQNLNHAS
jgi:chromosome segregation ATPase